MSAPERSFGIGDLVFYVAGLALAAHALRLAARACAGPAITHTSDQVLELRRRAAGAVDAELVGEAGGEGA